VWVLDIFYEAVMLMLGSLGAMLLLRAGIVHTGIVAQFILPALAFAYTSTFNLLGATLVAFGTSTLILVLSFTVRAYNPRTYLIVLYVFSLAAIQIASMVLNYAPGSASQGSSSPRVDWPFGSTVTVAVALLCCLFGFFAAHPSVSTWQNVLLAHWAQIPPAILRDLQMAGVFGPIRVLRAAAPTIFITSFCFSAAILFGCFIRYDAYSDGLFDVLPFWILLFGMLSTQSLQSLAIFVAVILLSMWHRLSYSPNLILIYRHSSALYSTV
jgi:hypothetical protein